MDNLINNTISPESKANVLQAIDKIKAELPFMVMLSEAELKGMMLIDDGRKPFVEKAFELATRNPFIDPGPGLIDAGKMDLDLYTALNGIEYELNQLIEMVMDTKRLAGAEAFETARFVYMKAKMAVKMQVPGSQAIADELGKLFKQTSSPAQPKP